MSRSVILFSLILFFTGGTTVFAQSQGDDLYSRGQDFIRAGDYSNAVIVLKRSLALHPQSARDMQTLAYAYSLNQDYKKAEHLIREVLRSNAADERTYQIAGNIYKAQNRLSAAQRNFIKGLKRFPQSGVMYSELGQVYFDREKYEKAVQTWVDGIKVAPDYAPNYYYAARTYYFSTDKFWTIIYGEIFVNLERTSNRTAEIKGKLLGAYKEVISNGIELTLRMEGESNDGFSTLKDPSFKEAVLQTLGNSAGSSIRKGVSPETMMMTRTQFLLNWDRFYKLVFPFSLFDYYRTLLEKGLFEAYNKWLFGPPANPDNYKRWVRNHLDKMHQLINFMNNHSLAPQKEEFYQKEKVHFIVEVK